MVGDEISSRASLGSSERVSKVAADESSNRAAVRSPEPIAKAAAQIQKWVMSEPSSRLHSPDSIVEQPKSVEAAAQAAPAHLPIEIERRAPEPATSLQGQKIEQRIANWCIAFGTVLRGRWRDAVWDFYERMTDVATWWRMIKPVLKFLARFIPGREPEPSRLSKAIKECFRDLPARTNSEAKKPEEKPAAPLGR